MTELAWVDSNGEHRPLQPLWNDGDRLYCRTWREDTKGLRHALMAVLPAAEHNISATITGLAHEFALREYLDSAWAARPLDLVHTRGRTLLLLESHGSCTLDSLLSEPLEPGRFLQLAPEIAHAIGQFHECGLVHKDIKPTNILIDPVSRQVWLTGFGIASRLPRERQAPEPPEFIAGTLPYMAPEQTGRMNRSIDSRSDLYALGVTFYQMLTGTLPFLATDPMEWVHCHIARRPLAPDQRFTGIPPPLSDIVMKLLAKTPEQRYQTAIGLEQDLRDCAIQWERQQHIEPFPLGRHDPPGRLSIPEKLYGRAREIAVLENAFNTIAQRPATAFVLVSGYTGIGKSSVVNELHKALVPPRGLFASGKFDQYKRDIPYATLAQALQRLIRPILARSEAELASWRETLLRALGPPAGLLVDLVPELRLIVGEQELVPELPASEAQRRFHLLLRRFIGVFARPEHPLALFFDDLQWLDAATLDLLEYLLTQETVPHLLLIGAYRDNEVSASHPFMRTLGSIKSAGSVSIEEINLGPLDPRHVSQLVADALHCTPDTVHDLAELISQKTGGNPFFVNRFLASLSDDALITFDSFHARWSWDLHRIHARGYTDNVIDLMIRKLFRLPPATQHALQQMACLGNIATAAMLAIVHNATEQELHTILLEARRQDLVEFVGSSCRFVHDRIQEAAYATIPIEERAAVHLRIGRLLIANTPSGKLDENAFELVNQFNRASDLITDAMERERAAELNLTAAKRAKSSTAYASALRYLHAGRTLLGNDGWVCRYDLMVSIESLTAECELLTADMLAAEARLNTLAQRVTSRHHLAIVTRLQITLYTTLDRSDQAIEVFLDYLRRNGTDWSPHPPRDDVMQEYNRIWSLLGKRQIEDLLHLPLLEDPDVLDMLDVFTEIVHPAMFFDENLSTLVVFRMVSLCLQHGNCDASCFGYVWFGMFAGPRFNNYIDGFRFGQLGYDLVEQRNLTRYQARTYISFATLAPWAKHLTQARELVRRAFDVAYQTGDLTFSAYSWHVLITNYLAVGDSLPEVQSEAEKGLKFVEEAGFGLVAENCRAQLALIRTLRGLTSAFGSLNTHDYNETDTEHRLAGNPMLALAEFFYWTRKLQARFFAGDYTAAVQASRTAHSLLWPAASQVETGDFRFFAALAHAAAWNSASRKEKPVHVSTLLDHYRQLQVWALHCPANFESKAALVSAEIARIEDRTLDAEHFYEAAIHSAHDNGFVHWEALANECAARFYAARGFARIARVYLLDARDGYLRWGADAKVRQLEDRHPQIKSEKTATGNGTILASVEQLDLATVIRVSEAVSSEIEQDKLVDTLMRTAIECAGAERGVLLLPAENDYRIEAEASTGPEGLTIKLHQSSIPATGLPTSVLQFVVRTKQSLLLRDAATDSSFAADEYIHQSSARSILCLPLLKQTRLLGVLYLENNLASDVFTPARMTVLKLLASAAAVSLENTRLYTDLREREARVRRLVESNIIGIFIWNVDGLIIDANDAFLQIIGHDREALLAGRLKWSELTPPEWRQRDEQALADVKVTGFASAYEKELFQKDGTRVPVLAGAAIFDRAHHEGVAFMVDLSDRRRAEDAARESERRSHDIQIQLEHANRVATLGQLSASIAHEVNQPITGAMTNAHTALLCLRSEVPSLDSVQLALTRIVRDCGRASDVLGRIRALVKKAPPQKDLVHVNDAIEDIVALTQAEATKESILCSTELASGLPAVLCDRVQLQQVILNLIMNAVQVLIHIDDEERRIVISTSTNTESVIVAVRDNGPGVEQENRERIFGAFYSTKSSGLGMGLSICRSIIEAHGGTLQMKNALPRGAIFEFTLPIELPTQATN